MFPRFVVLASLVGGCVGDESIDETPDSTSISSGEDAATSETTSPPGDDGVDSGSTGDPFQLCTHEPSGLVPGATAWEVELPAFAAADLALTTTTVWVLGTNTQTGAVVIQRVGLDGAGHISSALILPLESHGEPRQLIALASGRVVAAIDAGDGRLCTGCGIPWVFAFDDTPVLEPVWETGLAGSSFELVSTGGDTFIQVFSWTEDEIEFEARLYEFAAEGTVLRLGTNDLISGPVKDAAIGPLGDVSAIFDSPDWKGDWLAVWNGKLGRSWTMDSSSTLDAIARAPAGDIVLALHDDSGPVLRRQASEAEMHADIWQVELTIPPLDLEVDCDDAIVVVGDGVRRYDGDGTLQWETPFEGAVAAAAIDGDGAVLAIVNSEDGISSTLVKLAGS